MSQATRLVHHVFGDFAGQRGLRIQEPEAAGHQQREHHGSGQRETPRRRGALAKPCQRYFERAAHPAVERQRLIPEAAAIRAGGEMRGDIGRQVLGRCPDVQPRVAAVGPGGAHSTSSAG